MLRCVWRMEVVMPLRMRVVILFVAFSSLAIAGDKKKILLPSSLPNASGTSSGC